MLRYQRILDADKNRLNEVYKRNEDDVELATQFDIKRTAWATTKRADDSNAEVRVS